MFLGRGWLAVQQPLANRTANRPLRPLAVVNVSCVPAERELIHVAVQVLLADAVKRPVQSALQEREETLDGLGVNRAI